MYDSLNNKLFLAVCLQNFTRKNNYYLKNSETLKVKKFGKLLFYCISHLDKNTSMYKQEKSTKAKKKKLDNHSNTIILFKLF